MGFRRKEYDIDTVITIKNGINETWKYVVQMIIKNKSIEIL